MKKNKFILFFGIFLILLVFFISIFIYFSNSYNSPTLSTLSQLFYMLGFLFLLYYYVSSRPKPKTKYLKTIVFIIFLLIAFYFIIWIFLNNYIYTYQGTTYYILNIWANLFLYLIAIVFITLAIQYTDLIIDKLKNLLRL